MVFTTLGVIINTLTAIGQHDGPIDKEESVNMVKRIPGLAIGHGTPSLVDAIKPLLVDPTFIVNSSLSENEHIHDAVKVILQVFSAYYFQAFTYMATVKDVKVKKELGKLSTVRKPRPGMFGNVSIEADKQGKPSGKVTIQDGMELSVGKILELKLTMDNGIDVTLPVLIRANTVYATTESLMSISGALEYDSTLSRRWDEWRSGGITFWKDFVFASDLIANKKKLVVRDTEDIYTDVHSKANAASTKYVMTGEAQYGGLYNVMVVTESDLKSYEYKSGGKFTSSVIRDKFFSLNKILMLVVMDRDWDRMVIYTRDLDGYTTVGFSHLLKKSKQSMDMKDILGSFMNNQPARL